MSGTAGGVGPRGHLLRWSLLAGVALLTHVAFPPPAGRGRPEYQVGEVAGREVTASLPFVVHKAGEEIEREAEAQANAVRPVFRFDPSAIDSSRAALDRLIANGSAAAHPAGLLPEERAWLTAPGRERSTRAALDGFLTRTLTQGVADAGVVLAESSPELMLERDGRERVVSRDSLLTFADFLDRAEGALPSSRGPLAQRVFRKLAAEVFRPSIVPDPRETEIRRREARATVDSVKAVVRAGEQVVGAGEVVTPLIRQKLAALRAAERVQAKRYELLQHTIAPILYNGIILAVCWLLLMLYQPETYRDFRQVAFFAVLFAAVVLGTAEVAKLFPHRPELIPAPLAAILVTVLYDARLGVIAALVISVLLGAQWTLQADHTLYFVLVGGAAAAMSVRIVRRRVHLVRVIWITWAGYLAGAIILGALQGWPVTWIAASALTGVVTSVGCAALALLLLPVAESITRVTTDFTLIELSDPSRPLLRRLATEAPGTWAHSLMLANMCETAADAIGANGLLARVGCYYHDIGKLSRPNHFVENQAGGANPHDRLPPSESAAIIRSHVTDGLALAQAARLPRVVRAFIAEHHGTTPITYFLERARSRDPSVDLAAPEFHYPGPRPQSRETALVMLGDTVEAGVRTLSDPEPEQLRRTIDRLVDQKLRSRQLDDTPLTLRDIERVKEAFTRVVGGLHHARVEYPFPVTIPPDLIAHHAEGARG